MVSEQYNEYLQLNIEPPSTQWEKNDINNNEMLWVSINLVSCLMFYMDLKSIRARPFQFAR